MYCLIVAVVVAEAGRALVGYSYSKKIAVAGAVVAAVAEVEKMTDSMPPVFDRRTGLLAVTATALVKSLVASVAGPMKPALGLVLA